MFHYKSLFTDEVGAIRQRGPEPKKKSLKDKSSLPVHHKIVLHLASDVQKTEASRPQCSWGLFGREDMVCVDQN